jgi:hypothetical protein
MASRSFDTVFPFKYFFIRLLINPPVGRLHDSADTEQQILCYKPILTIQVEQIKCEINMRELQVEQRREGELQVVLGRVLEKLKADGG